MNVRQDGQLQRHPVDTEQQYRERSQQRAQAEAGGTLRSSHMGMNNLYRVVFFSPAFGGVFIFLKRG
jgi:hypothetical protein